MVGELTLSELTGLLDSIATDRHGIPDCFGQTEKYQADVLANAGAKNDTYLLADSFGSEIARHLRHIPVNPHNYTASELLRKSYVYSGLLGDTIPQEEVINFSESSAAAFMEAVISSAQREREFSVDPKGTDSTVESLFVNCVHVIEGERGVGKTFFLNHALTRFNDELDRQKTIWVRLNFVYASGFEQDLEYWMQAQAAKIILRYYDIKSKNEGKKVVAATDYLFGWIQNNRRLQPEDKARLRSALRSMEQVFGNLSEDEVLRPALCDKEICRELYRYMRVNGWSFIFVLDGFDQLDINPEQVKRFDTIQSSVKSFISMRANFGAAVVIVSRTNTFEDFRAYDPFKGIPKGRRYKIGDVDFSQVVRRRFDAIKEVVIKRIPPHRREIADRLEQTVSDFLKDWEDDDTFLSTTAQINVSNIRAKLQTLYLMFLNFANESTGKGYLILEHMLLNSMRYPAVAYEYSEASKDELIPSILEVSHEARFLPLITRYPLPSSRSSFTVPKNPVKHILVELRIIQLCMAAHELQESQEILSIGELTSMLSKCLGYSAPIVVAAINELAAFDVLRVIRREGLPANSPSNGVRILPKAKYVLEKCIHDVAYLNMCAMRTPLPMIYYTSRFVQGGYLGKSYYTAQNWVDKKITNSLALYCTMIFQNRIERTSASGKEFLDASQRERTILHHAIGHGLWDLVPSSRSKIAVEIQVLMSYPFGWLTIEEKETISEKVRSMFNFWRSRQPARTS